MKSIKKMVYKLFSKIFERELKQVREESFIAGQGATLDCMIKLQNVLNEPYKP